MATIYEGIRDAVYTAVNGIANIGNVYKQKKFARDNEEIQKAFKVTIGGKAQLRGWEISRATTLPVTGSFGKVRSRRYDFVITGYMTLQDSASTEQTFQILADTVADTLDALNWSDPTLSTTGVYTSGPCAGPALDEVSFGGRLCHRAVIHFPVEADKDVS